MTRTAANDNVRYYPPEWCSASTLAYLFDIAESTLHAYVARGLLPAGVKRGGSVRWHRETVVAAWGGSTVNCAPSENDNEDLTSQIAASIQRHGPTKKARR